MNEQAPYNHINISCVDKLFNPERIQPISVRDPHATTAANITHIDCTYIPQSGTFVLSHTPTYPDVIHARSIHELHQAIDTICPGAEYSLGFMLTYNPGREDLWTQDKLHLYYSSKERKITRQFYAQEQKYTTQKPGTCWIRSAAHTQPIHDIRTPILDIVCLHHHILSTYYAHINIPGHMVLFEDNIWSPPTPCIYHTIHKDIQLYPQEHQGQAIIHIQVYSTSFLFRNIYKEESLVEFIHRIYTGISTMPCPVEYTQHEHLTTLRILNTQAQDIIDDIMTTIEKIRPVFQQYYHNTPDIIC